MSQSILKACIIQYMAWPQPNGPWYPAAAVAFAEAHFNVMMNSYTWNAYPDSVIQSLVSAGIQFFGYIRLAQVEYSATPAYASNDWAVCNANESWFIHDAVTGSRIWNPTDSGFLMDIGNAAYRKHFIDNLTSLLAAYPGTTGIFLDNTIGEVNAGWIPWADYPNGTAPTFKTADLNNWHSNATKFLAQIKAAFPTMSIIINIDGQYNDYASQVDGAMIEGFVHATWQEATDFTTSPTAINQINWFSQQTAAGKRIWFMSGSSSGTPDQINSLVKYCLCGALLANNNPKSMYEFNTWFSFDNSYGYYPIMDNINLGLPTNPYYTRQGVYMRDYQYGKVLFNPTANAFTITLAEPYLLNGVSVTTLTLAAYSGEILTTTTLSGKSVPVSGGTVNLNP